MTRLRALFPLVLLAPLTLVGQQEHDKSTFALPKNEFFDTLKTESDRFAKPEAPQKKEFRLDFSPIAAPKSPADFTRFWHNPPISQGLSGMCWCFSTTSYYESEVYRLSGRKLKLSELYTVYWEYVEKTRRYVEERGNSVFGEGSEANAVARIWKKYGIVPEEAYTGLMPGQKYHDHRAMFSEMQNYLSSLKSSNAWDADAAIATIRSIMNHYIGEPPSTVTIEGITMTPKEYLSKVVKLNLDDYVDVMSLLEKPYYEQVEYAVPDNWWHSKEYYNVPLDVFMTIIHTAVREGESICIGGDTSEPGCEGHAGIAVVPTFDIPAAYIDENAREFRFSNGTTGDDHGIHIVGFTTKNGEDWYLIKDSGSGSRNNPHPGYFFYREDYVKLKMLGITIHRQFVEDVLKNFKH